MVNLKHSSFDCYIHDVTGDVERKKDTWGKMRVASGIMYNVPSGFWFENEHNSE